MPTENEFCGQKIMCWHLYMAWQINVWLVTNA